MKSRPLLLVYFRIIYSTFSTFLLSVMLYVKVEERGKEVRMVFLSFKLIRPTLYFSEQRCPSNFYKGELKGNLENLESLELRNHGIVSFHFAR